MTRGISNKTGKNNRCGRRLTVEQRRRARDVRNINHGHAAGWAEEALDYYLAGFPVGEILLTFEVTQQSFYSAIAKAALYRLMIQHQAERLEEIPELSARENK